MLIRFTLIALMMGGVASISEAGSFLGGLEAAESLAGEGRLSEAKATLWEMSECASLADATSVTPHGAETLQELKTTLVYVRSATDFANWGLAYRLVRAAVGCETAADSLQKDLDRVSVGLVEGNIPEALAILRNTIGCHDDAPLKAPSPLDSTEINTGKVRFAVATAIAFLRAGNDEGAKRFLTRQLGCDSERVAERIRRFRQSQPSAKRGAERNPASSFIENKKACLGILPPFASSIGSSHSPLWIETNNNCLDCEVDFYWGMEDCQRTYNNTMTEIQEKEWELENCINWVLAYDDTIDDYEDAWDYCGGWALDVDFERNQAVLDLGECLIENATDRVICLETVGCID